jgi:uncharacterized damage-inducible protein DinB
MSPEMSREVFAREADAYREFALAVAAVPIERREEAALPGGWSVKDALWHVVFWWRDGTSAFLAMHAGTDRNQDTTDDDTDATNARVLEESRAMSLGDVEQSVTAARTALLESFATVAARPEAEELFVSETIEHYDEHIEAIRTLAAT